MTKSVTEAEFSQQYAVLMEGVVENGDEVVLTKDGRPIAKVVPLAGRTRPRTLDELRGSITIVGDIVSPLDEEWNAEK